MNIEGQIISREFVKPSSPTPQEHKTHKLSLLDQIVPPIYVPLVLYYPNLQAKPKITPSQTTQVLKLSLSSTLSHFYPLAGRLKDSLSIDCNDEGVLFVISKFPGSLSGFLKNPDPEACRAHIPTELKWSEPGPGSHIAMFQVNYFECGGIAIGSLFLHKIADGVTIGAFMKAWAKRARGDGETESPDYEAKSFFPQNENMQRESHLFSAMRNYFRFGKTVMRRYVFDASGIAKLKSRLPGLKQGPTRVEVVSALLWKGFMVAAASASAAYATKLEKIEDYKISDRCDDVKDSSPNPNNQQPRLSLVTHGVNMRRKSETPFPENSFGNFVWLIPASSANTGHPDRALENLFSKVRTAIRKVDTDFVKAMQGPDGFSGYAKNLEETWKDFPENADYLAISSWCNFGLYTIDFGWGKPVWISKCDAGSNVEWPFINVLWLMDTRESGGVEAWLTMDEHYFAEFDKIQEIRDLALVDPSPLDQVDDDLHCRGDGFGFDGVGKSREFGLVDSSPLDQVDLQKMELVA